MVLQKVVINDAYTAAAITAGAVGVSYVSKKFLKTPFGVPETVNGAAKLAVAVGIGYVVSQDASRKEIYPGRNL